jgi:uncharacterized protein YcsI (UPF0317 family)
MPTATATDRSQELSPQAARALIRAGSWTTPTANLTAGYAQANLIVLPQEYAADFREFCRRNPKPCPVIEELAPGQYEPKCAVGADLRTDLPRYRVYRDGAVTDEPEDLRPYWRNDLCAFLIGCSFTFDWALQEAGLEVRHQTLNCNVPMYRTNIATTPVGVFGGPTVVSMRPFPAAQVEQARQISARYPRMHGSPLHSGDPAQIGISNIATPDYGEPVPVRDGEIPVFWACGVTPQAVVTASRLPFVLTHAPGHMFITDLTLGQALQLAGEGY